MLTQCCEFQLLMYAMFKLVCRAVGESKKKTSYLHVLMKKLTA